MNILLLSILATQAFSQTQVNLSRQSKNADFSAFTSTRPWRLVTSLPATCEPGEAVFVTGGTPGQQLNFCTSVDTWDSAGGGAAEAAMDFAASKTASNVVSIGSSCSTSKLCRARFGETAVSLSSPATITLGGVSGTGILFVWLDASGIRAGKSGANSITCNGFCSVESGTIADFPARSLPLAALTYSGNVFDAVTGAMDRRGFLSGQRVEAGPSGNLTITSNGATGAAEIDLNGELDFGGYAVTRVLRRGTLAQRPATCVTGDLYFQNDLSVGIYDCIAANQWYGPLASLAVLSTVDKRTTLSDQTGDAAASEILPVGHTAGLYRICGAASVSTAGSGSMNAVLSWQSPASASDLSATLFSVSVATTGEEQGCRVIRSTGGSAVSLNPSNAGTAVYSLAFTAERIQ